MSIHPGVVRAALRGCRPVSASRRVTVGASAECTTCSRGWLGCRGVRATTA